MDGAMDGMTGLAGLDADGGYGMALGGAGLPGAGYEGAVHKSARCQNIAHALIQFQWLRRNQMPKTEIIETWQRFLDTLLTSWRHLWALWWLSWVGWGSWWGGLG